MGGMSDALGTSAGNEQRNVEQNSSGNRYSELLAGSFVIVTGIGSRETPPADLALMTKIAKAIEERGGKGRSGGAGGADLAFERGFTDPANIAVYHPWKGFLPKDMTEDDVTAYLGRKRPSAGPGAPIMLGSAVEARAMEMAAHYHPAWDRCSQGAKRLHTRNMPQVLGETLEAKASLVVAWTVDGKATGGTGQALRIAADLGVPVANLKNLDERRELLSALGIPDPQVEAQKAQMMGWGR